MSNSAVQTIRWSGAAALVAAPGLLALEGPAHLLEHQDDRFEIRRMDPATNQAFRTLAGYIFGGNRSSQKIAMTALVPVVSADRGSRSTGTEVAR